MFQKLAAVWYPESNLTAGVATRLADSLSGADETTGCDPDLVFLDRSWSVKTSGTTPATRMRLRSARLTSLLGPDQLVENVWFEFKLGVRCKPEQSEKRWLDDAIPYLGQSSHRSKDLETSREIFRTGCFSNFSMILLNLQA